MSTCAFEMIIHGLYLRQTATESAQPSRPCPQLVPRVPTLHPCPKLQPCCFADLGSDQDRLKWYAEAEKTNGRWAMAAVAVSQQHNT